MCVCVGSKNGLGPLRKVCQEKSDESRIELSLGQACQQRTACVNVMSSVCVFSQFFFFSKMQKSLHFRFKISTLRLANKTTLLSIDKVQTLLITYYFSIVNKKYILNVNINIC